MSSPFGGPSSENGDKQNSSDTYRSSLGYGRSTSSSPSDYSGTGQTPFSNPGFGTTGDQSSLGRTPNRGYGGPGENPNQSGSASTGFVSERTPMLGYQDSTGLEMPFGKEYKFSAEEMRAVKECTRESFYYRSLPFAAVGAAVTHLAIRNGYLVGHPKYGTIPKVIGMTVAGFLMGKVSYWNTCQEKFLRIPDSRVGDAIRRRRTGEKAPARTQSANWNQPLDLPAPKVYEGAYPAVRESRFDQQVGQSRGAGEQSSAMNTDDYHNALDIDSEKNNYYDDASLDDRRPNSLDFDLDSKPGLGLGSMRTESDGQRSGATYDDLRRQHRDAYLRPQKDSQRQQ